MGRFRIRPPQAYGAPDWDLILRVFSDAAYVDASRALASEADETLVSVGGGVELQILRNMTLRTDVGHTLSNLSQPGNDASETRAHVAATVLY